MIKSQRLDDVTVGFVTIKYWCNIIFLYLLYSTVERGSSVVECRTRNQVSLCVNPPFATVSKFGHFYSLNNA